LIIPVIIQTIRLDPSRSVWIDRASNVSRPDPSGTDQIDVEHQATDLAVGGSNLSRRAKGAGQWPERIARDAYDRMIGLNLTDLAVDGCITKTSCGGEVAERSPVDRGRRA
jgi:hypothetical protein